MKKRKLVIKNCVGVLAVSGLLLSGCGGGAAATTEDLLADMKEFTTPDGSVSMYFDADWSEESLGVDSCVLVASENGNDGVLLMQFPKNSPLFNIDSIDSLKETMKGSYHVSDEKAVEAIEIPGMENVEVVECTVSMGDASGTSGDGYLLYGETDYAYYSIGYISTKMTDAKEASFRASCTTFVETPVEEEDATTVEITDTIRWFNASYAVLTKINGWDYNRFGGLAANETNAATVQQLLTEWWDVTDRASADENLEWILSEGHRATFAENMQVLEEGGLSQAAEADREAYLLQNYQVSAEEAAEYVSAYSMYEQYGAGAIDGWDYCRAMNLLGYYYIAGYYTETEALDKSLEVASVMQPLFGSWDELMDSYLRGYEYWAGESQDERRAVYEELKGEADNPYAVDFKVALEKSW